MCVLTLMGKVHSDLSLLTHMMRSGSWVCLGRNVCICTKTTKFPLHHPTISNPPRLKHTCIYLYMLSLTCLRVRHLRVTQIQEYAQMFMFSVFFNYANKFKQHKWSVKSNIGSFRDVGLFRFHILGCSAKAGRITEAKNTFVEIYLFPSTQIASV